MIISQRSRMLSPLCRRLSAQVENTGSTARDHLANERTFLAWCRTGLGFLGSGTGLFTAYCFGYASVESASSGQAVGRHVVHPKDVAPACGLLIANGGIMLGFAVRRYLLTQRALMSGKFIIAGSGMLGVVATTAALTGCSLSMLFKLELESKMRA
jgi:uncharacterized membrane protein YidH (DUF202 family)